jgi:hypothetical protein
VIKFVELVVELPNSKVMVFKPDDYGFRGNFKIDQTVIMTVGQDVPGPFFDSFCIWDGKDTDDTGIKLHPIIEVSVPAKGKSAVDKIWHHFCRRAYILAESWALRDDYAH